MAFHSPSAQNPPSLPKGAFQINPRPHPSKKAAKKRIYSAGPEPAGCEARARVRRGPGGCVPLCVSWGLRPPHPGPAPAEQPLGIRAGRTKLPAPHHCSSGLTQSLPHSLTPEFHPQWGASFVLVGGGLGPLQSYLLGLGSLFLHRVAAFSPQRNSGCPVQFEFQIYNQEFLTSMLHGTLGAYLEYKQVLLTFQAPWASVFYLRPVPHCHLLAKSRFP